MEFREALERYTLLSEKRQLMLTVIELLDPFIPVEGESPDNVIWVEEQKGVVSTDTIEEFLGSLRTRIDTVEQELDDLMQEPL